MFKTLLPLMALASLTIVTRSFAESDLPPLADEPDSTPTPAPVPIATPARIPLPNTVPGKWLTNENEAMNQAALQGKTILVDFDANWCIWCTKLHDEVLSRQHFKEFAAANLVLLRMDCPMPESRRNPAAVALLSRCNVTVFPTLLLMKADGEEIARYKGFAKESVIVQWLRSTIPGGENADSLPDNPRVTKREETTNSPGGRQVDQMQAIIKAMANYDWQTLEPYFVDGQTNYFGHRHVSLQYIINDITNDSRQFGPQDWTVYWDTFKHESDGDMAYDSVNAYVVVDEPGVRTHRALERLTIGYSADPEAAHGITIDSLTLKVLR